MRFFLSQGKYTVGILKKFSMTKCKSMPTPMVMDLKKINDDDSDKIDPQLIGSLMYLVNTRLDICYAVNVLSQFMSQSRQTHWTAAKHVLRYLQGTIGYGLRYASNVDLSLQGYADWTESIVDRKSISGCCFTLEFSMVSWCSKKTKLCGLEYHRSKVYNIECVRQCGFASF
jgi:hypothetical protein